MRVIVLDRKRRSDEKDYRASTTSKRMLDPVSWTVTDCDPDSGEWVLTRGGNRFVDQFELGHQEDEPANQYTTTRSGFQRKSQVRMCALLRANGKCELCQQEGFKTPDGKIYLETHHIVPLSEGGTDTDSNVVALCPNDHRRAHHSIERVGISEELNALRKKAE